jgi:PAS domain S-box-containing protein
MTDALDTLETLAPQRTAAFRGFFENLAVGGVQLGTDGQFLQVNDRYCRLTGYERPALLRMRVGDLDHPDDRGPDRLRWSEFLSDPDAGYDVEKRYVRRDGQVIWVHATAARIETGTRREIIAKTVEDITERVTARMALQEREIQLRRALAAREELLGLVSHELRTPLTVILGLAGIMARNTLPPDELRAAIAEIRESAEHLTSLLESMLVLARAGSDDDLALEPILADRSLERAVERHRQVFPNRDISLDVRARGSVVEGNEAWLSQVVGNLLGNAEKYSPADGRISVVLEQLKDDVTVRVADEGVGIEEADLPLLFEPFYRAERAQGHAEGLGLGLAVCKRLIELQGGTVWGRPLPSGGAEFGFSLPLLVPEHDSAGAIQA